jgi:hypothetical protein
MVLLNAGGGLWGRLQFVLFIARAGIKLAFDETKDGNEFGFLVELEIIVDAPVHLIARINVSLPNRG